MDFDFPLKEWMGQSLEIADRAGAAIMNIYESDSINKTLKRDNSPVTEADLAANEIIVSALEALTPDIAVVSEEGEKPEGHDTFWLVDPLDGTREFLKGNGEFTVNIALVHNRQPLLGVITAPALGLAYMGAEGMAAQKRDHGIWQEIFTKTADPARITLISSQRQHIVKSFKWMDMPIGIEQQIRCGSSLKFCLIAEGKAHLYPRLGRTMEWDTAAGQAILTAAGGSVVTEDGAPFLYKKPRYENPSFIATSLKMPF